MKTKFRKLKYVTKGRIKSIFSSCEDTKELVDFVDQRFLKNSTDCADFQEVNERLLAILDKKRAQIARAYEYHAQMLALASLKGQKLAFECIDKLSSEYQELCLIHRKFVKLAAPLRCTLGKLCLVDKENYDHESYISEANAFFQSILD